MIAAPGFVRWEIMEPHAFQRRFVFKEYATDPVLHFGVPDIDVHVLDAPKVANELGINRRDGLVFVRKTDAFRARPG
jgi:hypothetical protein